MPSRAVACLAFHLVRGTQPSVQGIDIWDYFCCALKSAIDVISVNFELKSYLKAGINAAKSENKIHDGR